MSKASPEDQARNRRAGKGGVVPPVEHRFQPGQSGNPGGRPRTGVDLTALLRKALQEDGGDGTGRQIADLIVQAGIERALAGDFPYWREIFQRIDGRAIAQAVVAEVRGPINVSLDDLRKVMDERGLDLEL